MTYDDFLDLVKQRRSIRRFKSDPVPTEAILKILEAARWAPSGFNMQPWEFVIVQKPELKTRIIEITGSYWSQSVEMEKARPAWQGRTWEIDGYDRRKGATIPLPRYISWCAVILAPRPGCPWACSATVTDAG